jgi:threonine dehydrogenase-like Zn-dependent dehydrogenase
MKALVYENPYQMQMRDVPVPTPQPDEVLIRVAYSGICGSELSGYEGKNSLRKPPLIMGHEFSGTLHQIGERAAQQFPHLQTGIQVTANPLISCNTCEYCMTGRPQLCPKRKLMSAALPGSNAEFVAVRADAIHILPDKVDLTTAALTEPAACAVHAADIVRPRPTESGLVVGAGPIGLLIIQALFDYGLKTIYCADLNAVRLEMAQQIGAIPLASTEGFTNQVDLAVDAVGADPTRQLCVNAVRSGGRIVWVGLHEAASPLPINDMIRREIQSYGSFAYNHRDFAYALQALAQRRLWLETGWTRIEPLERGAACFEELLHGSTVAKIWLEPK